MDQNNDPIGAGHLIVSAFQKHCIKGIALPLNAYAFAVGYILGQFQSQLGEGTLNRFMHWFAAGRRAGEDGTPLWVVATKDDIDEK